MNKELEEGYKKKLALFISGSISFVILCVWVFFFIQEKPVFVVKDSSQNGVALFEELKENVGANAVGIKESFLFIKETMGVFFTGTTSTEQTERVDEVPVIEE